MKKIAIVGPGAEDNLTTYDKTWEFWGINAAYRTVTVPRWQAMFNLHRFAHLERDCPHYVDWDTAYSRRHPKLPFYVLDSWGRLLKGQKIFPGKSLMTWEGVRARYHASSFDWLVHFALACGAKLIHIQGAKFALDSPRHEPISARACLEYWVGVAEGRGVQVTMGWDCDLFAQYHLVASHSVYGYDDVEMVENRTGKRMPRIG